MVAFGRNFCVPTEFKSHVVCVCVFFFENVGYVTYAF